LIGTKQVSWLGLDGIRPFPARKSQWVPEIGDADAKPLTVAGAAPASHRLPFTWL